MPYTHNAKTGTTWCIKSISENEVKNSVSLECEFCTSKTGIWVPEFSNSDNSDSEEVIEKSLKIVSRKKAYKERKNAREKKKAEIRNLYEQMLKEDRRDDILNLPDLTKFPITEEK